MSFFVGKKVSFARTESCQTIVFSEARDALFLKLIREGNQTYLNDHGAFVFEDTLYKLKGLSGNFNLGLFKASHQGHEYFIKQVSSHPLARSVFVDEVMRGKKLSKFGVAPHSSLVQTKGKLYIVQKFIPGVNIKDVLYPPKNTRLIKEMIDQMLNQNFANFEQARTAFARKFLETEGLSTRLDNIEKVLLEQDLAFASDFQVNVDLSPQVEWSHRIYLIDLVGYFSTDSSVVRANKHLSVGRVIENMYGTLETLAAR